MKILGIGFGYLSTAALMIDSKIVALISEERFTRNMKKDIYELHKLLLRVSWNFR